MSFQNTAEQIASGEEKLHRISLELSRYGAKLEEAQKQVAEIVDRTADLAILEKNVDAKRKEEKDLNGIIKGLKSKIHILNSQLNSTQQECETKNSELVAETQKMVEETRLARLEVDGMRKEMKVIDDQITTQKYLKMSLKDENDLLGEEYGAQAEQFDVDTENFLKKKFEYNQTLKELEADCKKNEVEKMVQKNEIELLKKEIYQFQNESVKIVEENQKKKKRLEEFIAQEESRMRDKSDELDTREAEISDKEAFLKKRVDYLNFVKTNIENELGHKLNLIIE